MKRIFLTSLITILLLVGAAEAQTTAFTYQGKLNDNGLAANAGFDLQFKLFDSNLGGNQVGGTVAVPNVAVANGIFTVRLDFGAVFDGTNRFLEIALRPAGSPNAYTVLAPRQPVTSTPYAIRSIDATNAQTAADSQSLGGVAANQYVVTGDARLSDARQPLAGSPDYIQNTNSPQLNSNFSISGNGTAGGTLSAAAVNAEQGFNFGGARVFFRSGTSNLFAGLNAGGAITGGTNNAFFGDNAGVANDDGTYNSFFGNGAGQNNQVGTGNSFYGFQAGNLNTIANKNSFFGMQAGKNNTVGSNSFFGYQAGLSTDTGSGNSFFGQEAGKNNTSGRLNVFIGATTGGNNISGSNNTLVGQGANFGSGAEDLNFATALGSGATVTTSNTVVLGRTLDTVRVPGDLTVLGTLTANGGGLTNLNAGSVTTGVLPLANGGTGLSTTGAAGNFLRSNGAAWTSAAIQAADVPDLSASYIGNSVNQQTANFNISGDGTAGGTLSANVLNSTTEFRIGGNRVFSVTGSGNVFAGNAAGPANLGSDNSFFGSGAGFTNGAGGGNSFFGRNAGLLNFSGSNNTFLGASAGLLSASDSNNTFVGANTSGTNGVSFATALGAGATVTTSNTVALGRNLDTVKIPGNFNVAGDSTVNKLAAFGRVVLNDNMLMLRSAGEIDQGILYSNTVDGPEFRASGGFRWTNNNGGTELMRLASNGNLGIGTNNPLSQLTLGNIGNINYPFSVGRTNCGSHDGFAINFGGTVDCSNWTLKFDEDFPSFYMKTFDFSVFVNGETPFRVINDVIIGSNAKLVVAKLGAAGATALCRNVNGEVSSCSSSLRYKTNLAPFTGGLDVIDRLKPISFDWKAGGLRDLGFGAEDIAAVEPLLVTYNTDGQVEGVKYDRLSTVFVNAFKEQQAEIAEQQTRIGKQQAEIAEQKKLIDRQAAALKEQQTTVAAMQRQLDALAALVCRPGTQSPVCAPPAAANKIVKKRRARK
ncbi:MAG: tail fiber domain-containing protein [Acidobacteria bacterium]|nr:tail fiber domain-containing protein [Acidobacteriota bacterium]